LLLDEPSTSLDLFAQHELRGTVRRLERQAAPAQRHHLGVVHVRPVVVADVPVQAVAARSSPHRVAARIGAQRAISARTKRSKAAGVRSKINGVEIDGEPFPALNNTKWDVNSGGSTVGKVTSAIYSPRLEANIGYAWLPAELSTAGTAVEVHAEWGTRTATVVEMPFVDPNKQIPVS
jgi:hypothetical protein